jgi:hypothetical protein
VPVLALPLVRRDCPLIFIPLPTVREPGVERLAAVKAPVDKLVAVRGPVLVIPKEVVPVETVSPLLIVVAPEESVPVTTVVLRVETPATFRVPLEDREDAVRGPVLVIPKEVVPVETVRP